MPIGDSAEGLKMEQGKERRLFPIVKLNAAASAEGENESFACRCLKILRFFDRMVYTQLGSPNIYEWICRGSVISYRLISVALG
jgi:hypothetical protein